MNNKLLIFAAVLALVPALAGCTAVPSEDAAAPTSEPLVTADVQAPAADDEPASPAEISEPEADVRRQDGERFEKVILLEGMEETVGYEHVRNEAVGFEMDYEYETFVRHGGPSYEWFVSLWDDAEDPRNYLEVMYSAADAETVAESVTITLSDDYDLLRETYTLENAGSCIRIDATHVRSSVPTPAELQMVYIIPAADGCRIATAHYSTESAEGLGRRFDYMINTLEVIARNPELADLYEAPPEDLTGWTGADFGELPPEDFEGWGDGEPLSDDQVWTSADFGELPPEDFEGWGDGEPLSDDQVWTGADFGELPPEDFFTGADYGELPPEDFGG